MRNACKINSDGSVSILLNVKGGETLEAIVTKEHYDLYAEPFAGTWTAYKHQRTGKYYARGTYRNPETDKVDQPMLHRLIMNQANGNIVGHLDHNTLNCLPKNMVYMAIGADLQAIIEELQEREDHAVEAAYQEAEAKKLEDAKVVSITPPATPENVDIQLPIALGTENQGVEIDYLDTKAYQEELAAAEVEDRRLNGPGTEDYDGLPYACITCGQIMYTAGNNGKCDACIAKEQQAEAGDLQPVKGVSFHKIKKRWETGPTYEKVRYRLGYWPPEELAAANAAVTEFRAIGPEAYFIKYPKKGGN
jgi:rubrerythrin